MSGHAHGILAQLKKADEEPNITVSQDARKRATINVLQEQADEIQDLQHDDIVLDAVDTPLADIQAQLRRIADAIDHDIHHQDTLNEILHTNTSVTTSEAIDAYHTTQEGTDQ